VEGWRRYHWTNSQPLVSGPAAPARRGPEAWDLPRGGGFRAPEPPSPDGLDELSERRATPRRFTRQGADEAAALGVLASAYRRKAGLPSGVDRLTTPSAGAQYPLRAHVLVWSAEGPRHHLYTPWTEEFVECPRPDGLEAAFTAACLGQVPPCCLASVVLLADVTAMTTRYGDRGYRYALIESGHVAQNICLRATARDLAVQPQGGFDDAALLRALDRDSYNSVPLYVLHLGVPAA
jgi:SagB-type dehydrogenase family enzyme